MKTILSIAGSDCSGGAGIQADLKTISAFGMYGMSVITALVAENTQEVRSIVETPVQNLADQCDCVFQDIFPDAVKIGMTGSAAVIRTIAAELTVFRPRHVVFDPVMTATSGKSLMETSALEVLKKVLLPLVTVLTPNLKEAEILAGQSISNHKEMEDAAEKICSFYPGSLLIKGGHLEEFGETEISADLLYYDGKKVWLESRRIHNSNTHGTGCTLSSAIACGLADGLSVLSAVQQAKEYLCCTLSAGLQLGHGNGPLQHNVLFSRRHS